MSITNLNMSSSEHIRPLWKASLDQLKAMSIKSSQVHLYCQRSHTVECLSGLHRPTQTMVPHPSLTLAFLKKLLHKLQWDFWQAFPKHPVQPLQCCINTSLSSCPLGTGSPYTLKLLSKLFLFDLPVNWKKYLTLPQNLSSISTLTGRVFFFLLVVPFILCCFCHFSCF